MKIETRELNRLLRELEDEKYIFETRAELYIFPIVCVENMGDIISPEKVIFTRDHPSFDWQLEVPTEEWVSENQNK